VGFYSRYGKFSSTKSCLIIYFSTAAVVVAIVSGIQFATPIPYTHGTSPECLTKLVNFLTTESVILTVLAIFSIARIWKVQDAYYIKVNTKNKQNKQNKPPRAPMTVPSAFPTLYYVG